MISQDDVRCSVCHQEHLGADADLLAVSDAKCQSCHQNQFASFSDDHPDWHSWPYGRGGEIAFDHATHANQHFPSTNRRAKAAQFQCNDCHQRSPSNEILRTVSYEFACASCHDQALRAETSLGITLLAVPTLPVSATEKAGSWPEAALGFFDGELSPLSELLHRGDPLVTAEIRRIPRRDFSAIDESNAVETDAALRVAIAQRRLLRELARHGGESIQRRMAATPVAPRLFQPLLASLSPQMVQSAYRSWFPNDASSHQTNVGAKHFSPFSGSVSSVRHPFALVSDRIAGSLNTTAVEDEPTSATPQGHLAPFADESLLASDSMQPGLLDGDLLDEDLTGELSDDALLSDDSLINAQGLEEWNEQDEQLTEFTEGHSLAEPDPLSDSHHGSSERLADSSRFDAERMLPVGGWYRDDASLSIRYRGNGHADPVLRSIIEIASQLPSGDPVRQRLLKTRSVAACVSCHRSAPVSTGSWKSLRLEDRRGDFTKFSHEPHLNVAILSDCTHCHQVRPGRGLADLGLPNSDHASVAGSSTFTEQATNSLVTGAFMPPSGGDFLPLGRDSCVACHTKAAAGDACVQCHRYHIGPEASPPHVIDALPRSLQSE